MPDTPSIKRILVVDDEPLMRATLREFLEEFSPQPYRVTAVPGIRAAQETLREERFDLVLADLKLPGGSGLTLLQDCGSIPLIVVTGTDHENIPQGTAGVAGFIRKPFTLDALLQEIEKALKAAPAQEPEGPNARKR